MTTPCVSPVMGPPTTALNALYLGKPGSMTKLRLPDGGSSAYASPLSRGEVAHRLSGGGTSTTRRRRVKREWPLLMSSMSPDDAEALVSYYAGTRGLGPFRLIDPAWRNQLSLDASTMSSAFGAPAVWSSNASDTASVGDTTDAPPIAGGGVWKWVTPVNTHYQFQGTQAGGLLVPDVNTAVPYLADQPYTMTVYVRTLTSTTNVKLAALGCTATQWDGTSIAATGTIGLTTAWQRLTVQVAIAAWNPATVLFAGLGVQCVAAGAPTILLSAAMIDVGVTGARPFVTGLGAARVTISAGLGAAMSHVFWRRDTTLTLSEA